MQIDDGRRDDERRDDDVKLVKNLPHYYFEWKTYAPIMHDAGKNVQRKGNKDILKNISNKSMVLMRFFKMQFIVWTFLSPREFNV